MTLEKRFTTPDHWQWDYFTDETRADIGHKIRYGLCHAKSPRGLVVIAQGRTQTAEEYFEIIRDFLDRQFSVAIMDWQGHGGSYRLNNDNTRHHSNGFDEDVRDLGLFINKINAIDEFQKLPRILFAHSMGGHLSLHYIIQNPDIFTCAFMVAPMFGIKMNAFLNLISPPILTIAKIFGKMNKHAIGQRKWNEQTYDLTKPFVSSDKIRRNIQKYWFLKNPELQCSGVTYGWIDAAFKSCRLLKDKTALQSINTPLFFAVAEQDKVVSNTSIRHVARHIPNCEIETFKKAQHVIQAERDDIRDSLLHSFDLFVEKHLP